MHDLKQLSKGFIIIACSLALMVAGCESFQQKFVRKPKQASRLPSPIISFQDYSGAMTPLERYRKHYIMFDYWNQDMLDSLQARSPNPKRYRRASEESLSELKTLQSLLNDEPAGRLSAHIDERIKIDHQAQTQEFSDMAQVGLLVRRVELQTREIHRGFFWRDVQDELKTNQPPQAKPSETDAAVH